jgi:mono/diheme cytochrome c family protein
MRTYLLLAFVAVPFLGCSSSSSGGTATTGTMEIVTVSGGPVTAVAGDALALKVVEKMADGSTQDLPSGSTVAWSGPPTVTASEMAADSAYPMTAATPTAVWLANPGRTDRAQNLAGVLFVIDAGSTAGGSVMVSATVSGAATGSASASIPVAAPPDGDVTRGAALYGKSGANCAECHGDGAQGTMANTDGKTYTIDGAQYDFPAPPIDAEDGDAAAEWTAPFFALASRADVDDEAVSLRLPMPDWLTTPSPASGKPLSTQDFADIFAYLQTLKGAP